MTTVGLYLRISDDKAAGAGVVRQQQDTEDLAKRRGWAFKLYIDNSVSAYKKNVRRPEFERLVADLTTRAIDGFVVWDIDRLARQPKDLERLVDLYEPQARKRKTVVPLVFGTCQGEIDLSNDTGIWMARTLVNMANKSSADTARRVARAHLQRSQDGRVSHARRAYGWAEDKISLHPVEAPLLRKAAEDVLAGLSLHGIVNRWNDEGVPTASGTRWLKATLRMKLLSPRLAGYGVHHGEIALDREGKPVVGPHKAIVTVEQWETLHAILTDPARGKNVHPGGRKYLLAGIIRCGRCSSLMVGNARTAPYSHFYSCKGVCRSNNIDGAKTDEAVASLYAGYMADLDETDTPDEPWTGEEESAGLRARIKEVMDAFNAGQMPGVHAFASVEAMERRVAELNSEKAQWRRNRAPVHINAHRDWNSMTIEEQRAELAAELVTVAVAPVTRRTRFDAARLSPIWRRTAPAIPATA